jgi:hypothetical protein
VLVSGAILIIVAASLLILTLFRAGAIVLLVGFACLTLLLLWLASGKATFTIAADGMKALRVAVATVPFFVIRQAYLLLVEFGSLKFNPVLGDWRYVAGMDLMPELSIMVILISAVCIVEPVTRGVRNGQFGGSETKSGESEPDDSV